MKISIRHPMRKKTIFVVTAVAIICVVSALFVITRSTLPSRTTGETAYASVRIGDIDVNITSASDMEWFVLKPLRAAQPEPNPAAYVPIGSLTITYPYGASETYALYAPWGHYSRNGKYYSTDLSLLRMAISERIEAATRSLQEIRAIK